MMRGRWALASAAMAAVASSACSPAHQPAKAPRTSPPTSSGRSVAVPSPQPPRRVFWTAAACPPATAWRGSGLDPGGGGPIPATFHVTEVIRCRTVFRLIPGRGKWSMLVEQRATQGFAAFVSAMRAPPATASPPISSPGVVETCPGDLVIPPFVLFVDAHDRAIRPDYPTGECGAPSQVALDALARVPFHTVRISPVAQTQSQLSVHSGCFDRYKDVIAQGIQNYGDGPSMWPPAIPRGKVQICAYQAKPAHRPTANDDGEAIGDLTAAGVLDPADLRRLLAGLKRAPNANSCHQHHNIFLAVAIRREQGPRLGYLELDSCRRWFVNGRVKQLNNNLISLIRSHLVPALPRR